MNTFKIQLDTFLPDAVPAGIHFSGLTDIVVCQRLDEVIPALHQIEAAVRSGLHAAGMLTYEAAQAIDPLLRTHSASQLPLLCFGIFKNKTRKIRRKIVAGNYSIGDLKPEIHRHEFARAIAKIHRAIAAGDTYQVNYTYRMNSTFSGDAFAFYQRIGENQRAAYNAFIEIDDFAIASASPELFFSWKNGVLTTRPMKGTAPRGYDLAGDMTNTHYLQNSQKEMAENVMIVDLLRNDMNRIAVPGTVRVEKLFEIEKFETLLQMTSTIRSEMPARTNFAEIFQALFPCGSITGAPKIRTMEIIKNLERSARGIYTGCIGYFSPGPEAVFNVAIRTAVIDRAQGKIQIGVGAGITIASEALKEYDECRLKARFFTLPAPRFRLIETMRYDANGGLFLLREHMHRLRQSAAYFRFKFPEQTILSALQNTVNTKNSAPLKIRLLLQRSGRFEIQIRALKSIKNSKKLRLAFAEKPVSHGDLFLQHKTTRRQIYDERLAIHPDCDDVILCNERGEVTETTIGNIVAKIGHRKYTPPIDCGLLPGTFRQNLLQRGEITERILYPADLLAAGQIWRINSVSGMQTVEIISATDNCEMMNFS